MSVQWTIVATFLYTEMALCVLLMLPFISPSSWRKVFKSRLFNAFTSYANVYFTIILVILVILFIDGVRDVSRYSKPLTAEERNNPTAEINLHMKLFRSQRNFYIAGFALFLSFVIRRLVTLISSHGALQADCDAARRQAESATEAAKRFMETQDNKNNKDKKQGKAQEDDDNQLKIQLGKAHEEVDTLRDELTRSKTNLDAMKQQAEATNREYDRLLEEHAKLQKTVEQLSGNAESKKDE